MSVLTSAHAPESDVISLPFDRAKWQEWLIEHTDHVSWRPDEWDGKRCARPATSSTSKAG